MKPATPAHRSVYFVCEITGGAARPSIETSDVAFFDRNALPSLSLGRVFPDQIERLFEHRQYLELPTDFD